MAMLEALDAALCIALGVAHACHDVEPQRMFYVAAASDPTRRRLCTPLLEGRMLWPCFQ